ncbi:MAG: response regulator transcription factor [Woeseia sp.]|nr:response regulator transcription factor [Woeseia sp.]MBT8096691.1 response regulator transcription factor [Woeseia sp.]NNE60928.1 response regulator transcription factor [Woeseia sp.]NNL54092.1 response regulator transcription factor [Woeseia sp.]
MPKTRLALIDDHRIVRDGLKALLSKLEHCEVIAEGGCGEDAVALADHPDIEIFLMDIALPGINGIEAAARICEVRPDARIIMLSMHANGEYVRRAMSNGAAGYILKNMAPSELEQAIAKVAAGGQYLSPAIADAIVATGADGNHAPVLDALSRRQLEILGLLADGHSTREIAVNLSISAKTVETHRSQLMQRLEIYDVPGLVRFAVRHGLVSVDE